MVRHLRDPLRPTKYISEEKYRWVVMNLNLGSVFVGYSYTYFNAVDFEQLAPILTITEDLAFYQGFLSSLVTIGAAIGAFISGPLLEHFSRKNSFLVTGVGALVAMAFLQLQVVWILIICRLIQGIASGVYFVILALYIKEFTPVELVGRFAPFMQLFFIVGMVYAYAQTFVLQLLFSLDQYWRVVFALPILILGVHLYFLQVHFPFQTPKYLVEQKRFDEARELLRKFIKEEYVQERVQELQKYIMVMEEAQKKPQPVEMRTKDRFSASEVSSDVDYQMQVEGCDVRTARRQRKRWLGRSAWDNMMAIVTAYHLSVLYQMTAITVIYIYVRGLIQQVYPALQTFLPVVIHGEGIAAIFLTMHYIKTIGRKTILQIGTMGCAICLIMISLAFMVKEANPDTPSPICDAVAVLGVFCLRAVFSFTFAPVHPLYLAEIVQPYHLANGCMLMFIFAGLTAFFFPVLDAWFGGPAWVFMIFGVYTLLSFFVNQYLLIQTQNKIEVEIRKEYRQKSAKLMGPY